MTRRNEWRLRRTQKVRHKVQRTIEPRPAKEMRRLTRKALSHRTLR